MKKLTKEQGIVCWKCKGVFSRDKNHTCICHELEKPQKQKGCGKEVWIQGTQDEPFRFGGCRIPDYDIKFKCGVNGNLCSSCSGDHAPVQYVQGKEPDVLSKKKFLVNLSASGSDFDLSEEIKDTKREIERQKKDIKAGRREGKTYLVLLEQRLFYLEKFQKFIKKLKEEIKKYMNNEIEANKEEKDIMIAKYLDAIKKEILEKIDKLVEELSGR